MQIISVRYDIFYTIEKKTYLNIYIVCGIVLLIKRYMT